jgi:hypothetical protein
MVNIRTFKQYGFALQQRLMDGRVKPGHDER